MKKLLSLLLVLVLLLGVLPGAVFAEDEGSVDFVVLSTTDMHGKCWDKNVLTEGNENNTMLRVSTAVSALATPRLRLPMRGAAESLNAAVAAGIVIYMMSGLI